MHYYTLLFNTISNYFSVMIMLPFSIIFLELFIFYVVVNYYCKVGRGGGEWSGVGYHEVKECQVMFFTRLFNLLAISYT